MIKIFTTLIALTISVISFGQKSRTSDQIRNDLNLAKFSKPIKLIKTIFFSNPSIKDTVILTVDTGLIYKSKSHITIKTFENRTVFYETFSTVFFSRGVFYPDTIPQGNQAIYDKFLDNYMKSVSKTKIENFTLLKINSFLNDIVVNKSELKEFKDIATDKQLYNRVMNDKNSLVIWLPIFESDEGVRYFTYSSTKKAAIKFLETD